MTNTTQRFAASADKMIDHGADAAHNAVAKSADKADELIASAQGSTAAAEEAVQAGVHQLREVVPATLSRTKHKAEDLARAGLEKAKAAGSSIKQQAHNAGESTLGYVREEPTKALVIAAMAGAALTLLIGWGARSRAHHSN